LVSRRIVRIFKPHWKPKGGQEFIFPVDSDWAIYVDRGEMVEAIDQMLANQSNVACKYEYVGHEVDFGEPIVLEGLEKIREEIFGEAK
jgi:hypothetical protein